MLQMLLGRLMLDRLMVNRLVLTWLMLSWLMLGKVILDLQVRVRLPASIIIGLLWLEDLSKCGKAIYNGSA